MFTIIIPVYNEQNYIVETIACIKKQTYNKFKVLISDNCSTDKTYELLQYEINNDCRFKCYRQNENIGICRNFYFLLNKVKTKYVLYLGGHDMVMPNYLEECLIKIRAHKNISLFTCKQEILDYRNIQLKAHNVDLDTSNLNKADGYRKIISQKNIGSSILGVYDLKVLKMTLLGNMRGGDIMLAIIAQSQGIIVQSEKLLFKRVLNHNETKIERLERYKEYKLCKNPSKRRQNVVCDTVNILIKSENLVLNEVVFIFRMLSSNFCKINPADVLKYCIEVKDLQLFYFYMKIFFLK